MAFITLNTQKLKDNFRTLDSVFQSKNIEWAIVAKLLCGNELYLEKLLELNPKQICDSRASNLQMVKKINPNVETIYIKPPPKRSIDKIVKYANISFNTELETIKLLSKAAVKQNVLHKVVIMVELGELREGILGDSLISFYEQVFELPHIEIIGIGTNLTCMYGVLPNADKLIQLSLYKQILEIKFDREIKFLSGGASVTIPLILNGSLPVSINHFRVGESLYLGTNVYDNTLIDNMHYDVFKLYAEVIELHEKPMIPSGEMGLNLLGDKTEFDSSLEGSINYRAIIDLGLLDIEIDHITPADSNMKIVGASSDMIVIDLDQNQHKVKVGDLIPFKMNYMGILRIMNSDYVEKKIE
ncbi:alanine racemase [Flavobacterium sp. NKUCC04_CG]|uniref:alanine racemase n=1 Tax=Flavobacterium sp. NKUCC04_CG TaxID=2842121 RepID=UPI001C5B15E3|nr:alanine racemase [Flavobacterium sp. NKUCC04_CG]MBW3518667.1 alanine racemase [Flavobacterium sp. NKUCC04_CG]